MITKKQLQSASKEKLLKWRKEAFEESKRIGADKFYWNKIVFKIDNELHRRWLLLDRDPESKRNKQKWISHKIRLLRHEKYPQRQAIAIAFSMARKKFKNSSLKKRDPGKIKAVSRYRYRATAQERRLYGGNTVTEFFVFYDEDEKDPSKWKIVRGYGKTPGERKTDAIKRSGLI